MGTTWELMRNQVPAHTCPPLPVEGPSEKERSGNPYFCPGGSKFFRAALTTYRLGMEHEIPKPFS